MVTAEDTGAERSITLVKQAPAVQSGDTVWIPGSVTQSKPLALLSLCYPVYRSTLLSIFSFHLFSICHIPGTVLSNRDAALSDGEAALSSRGTVGSRQTLCAQTRVGSRLVNRQLQYW